MIRLTSRERKVFRELSAIMLEPGAVSHEQMICRAEELLERATGFIRLFFRFSLHSFEWGTFFLKTGSGRFEHFSRLPLRAKQRYLRLWLNHPSAIVRQIANFLKIMVLTSYYDDRKESARIGYAPKWLC